MNVCAVAIVFLLDVSASVSFDSWDKQKFFTADALEHPAVASIIENTPDGIVASAMIFANNTKVVVPWSYIQGQGERAKFAQDLRDAKRHGVGYYTHVDKALGEAISHMAEAPCKPVEKIIDISTDGIVHESEISDVENMRAAADQQGIKINAIGFGRSPHLREFLDDTVKTNSGFSTVAETWESYAVAIRRKIMKEIALK